MNVYTYIFSESLNSVISFNVVCYNVDEKKKRFPAGHWLCGVFTFSPCLCGFSPGSPVLSYISMMCVGGELSCLHCSSLSACGVCVSGPWTQGQPVQGGSHLELPGEVLGHP